MKYKVLLIIIIIIIIIIPTVFRTALLETILPTGKNSEDAFRFLEVIIDPPQTRSLEDALCI